MTILGPHYFTSNGPPKNYNALICKVWTRKCTCMESHYYLVSERANRRLLLPMPTKASPCRQRHVVALNSLGVVMSCEPKVQVCWRGTLLPVSTWVSCLAASGGGEVCISVYILIGLAVRLSLPSLVVSSATWCSPRLVPCMVFSVHPLLVWVVYVCCLWSDRLAQLVEGRRDIASVPPPSVDCIHALSFAQTNAIYITAFPLVFIFLAVCSVLSWQVFGTLCPFFPVFSTAKCLAVNTCWHCVLCAWNTDYFPYSFLHASVPPLVHR